MKLAPGTVIQLTDGTSVRVLDFLGQGGQGEVYRVVRESDGAHKALKWYTNPTLIANTNFRNTLRYNSGHASPSPAFMWPEAVSKLQHGSFGYIMPLRPEGYYDLGDFFCIDRCPDAYFRSFMAKTMAALRICDSFSSLHRLGLSYQDINDGNFLINPHTGDVMICDTDNTIPDGYNNGIGGKSRYMAPEVMLGHIPSRASDRLSLAIILYRIFMVDHPFEGALTSLERYRCLTPEVEKNIFGIGAVFCYDADDSRNRPVAGLHDNSLLFWPMLPEELKALFRKALARRAIHSTADRVDAAEWIETLTRVRANILTCKARHADPVHDFMSTDESTSVCPLCGSSLLHVKTLCFNDGRTYRLTPGKQLYLGSSLTPFGVCGLIKGLGGHTTSGLQNTSGHTWKIALSAGAGHEVPPGATCQLIKGMYIRFHSSLIATVH